MTTDTIRPITVTCDLSIFFTAQANKHKLIPQLLSAFAQHGGLLKDGDISVPAPVTEYQLPAQFVSSILDAGCRFTGPLGRWLNATPRRMHKIEENAAANNGNSGGFAYSKP